MFLEIVGLFAVVFASAAINHVIGFSQEASTIGMIIGAGTYILNTKR